MSKRTVVAVHVAHQNQQLTTGKFMFDICDCCTDVGLCCDVCCCFWCTYGRMWSASEGTQDHLNLGRCVAIAIVGSGPLLCSLIISSCVKGFPPLCGFEAFMIWQFVAKMKEAWGIPRVSCCVECCFESCLCGCCTMIRITKEMRARGVNPGYTCCQESIPTTIAPVTVQPMNNIGIHSVPTVASAFIQPGYACPTTTTQGYVGEPGQVIHTGVPIYPPPSAPPQH